MAWSQGDYESTEAVSSVRGPLWPAEFSSVTTHHAPSTSWLIPGPHTSCEHCGHGTRTGTGTSVLLRVRAAQRSLPVCVLCVHVHV